ncbi:MAG: translation initiation factor IF-2 N-terminal domain-containing protein [Lachnospiraceae bacterium]|nr:translation initiation factor IF-2 N-terminal domain-containing protein [Lachnospiraceae bacterium]
MATKMKVYEIAKSLNRQSKDLLKALNENGFEVKSHNSNIEDEAIAFVLNTFKPKAEEEKVEEKKEEKVLVENKKMEKMEEKKDTEIKGAEKTAEKEEKTAEKVQKIEKNENDEEKTKIPEEKKVEKMSQENTNNQGKKYNQNNDRRNDRNNGQRKENNYQNGNSEQRGGYGNRTNNDRGNDRNGNRSYDNNNGNERNNNRKGNRNFDRNNSRNNDRKDIKMKEETSTATMIETIVVVVGLTQIHLHLLYLINRLRRAVEETMLKEMETDIIIKRKITEETLMMSYQWKNQRRIRIERVHLSCLSL